jgi:hypothetical protein
VSPGFQGAQSGGHPQRHDTGQSKIKGMSMPSENLPETDSSRMPSILPGLPRAFVFVLLGPVFGVIAAWSMITVLMGGPIDPYGIPIAFFFSLIVCAITGPVDGVLAYVVPISLRVPLTAIAGAAVAVGVYLYLYGAPLGSKLAPSLHRLIAFALFGALNTGACSLLSYPRTKA